ncbi:hypothetical protein [Sphingopyxis sp.]|uniref:hypothetical protein n=1 Tax=Sphingopyxis sp. TaxID=1908224 RepID=UPI002ED87C7F
MTQGYAFPGPRIALDKDEAFLAVPEGEGQRFLAAYPVSTAQRPEAPAPAFCLDLGFEFGELLIAPVFLLVPGDDFKLQMLRELAPRPGLLSLLGTIDFRAQMVLPRILDLDDGLDRDSANDEDQRGENEQAYRPGDIGWQFIAEQTLGKGQQLFPIADVRLAQCHMTIPPAPPLAGRALNDKIQ